MKAAFLLGRVIFGGYFIYNGINHFLQRDMMTGYAKSKNVPYAEMAIPATGAMLAIGGTSLLLGVKPKIGAAAIIGFLASVSPVMHDFWRHEDQQQRMNEMINFSKNVAMAGAALALLSVEEPWPASLPVEGLDWRKNRDWGVHAAA